MTVALATGPRNSHAHEGAKRLEVSKGSGASAEDIDGREVTAGGLGEAVADPVRCLNGEGMHSRTEVSKLKEYSGKAKAGAPHAFHKSILLRGIRDRRVVSDLVRGKEVTEIMRHELAALVRGNHVGSKFVSQAHEEAEINKKQV